MLGMRSQAYLLLSDASTIRTHSSNESAGQLLSTLRKLGSYGRGAPPNQLTQPWPGIKARGTSNSLTTNVVPVGKSEALGSAALSLMVEFGLDFSASGRICDPILDSIPKLNRQWVAVPVQKRGAGPEQVADALRPELLGYPSLKRCCEIDCRDHLSLRLTCGSAVAGSEAVGHPLQPRVRAYLLPMFPVAHSYDFA
jgi:hypothetical protein